MTQVALVGNPNSGKTTLFNRITGAQLSVGNWPGVTVEKRSGQVKADGRILSLVDLPGLYALSSYSLEERISREALLDAETDVILNIVDGSHMEHSLYLTLALLELGKPMVVAVNMMDEVRAGGQSIDIVTLGQLLGVPLVPIVARSGEGVRTLLAALGQAAFTAPVPVPFRYGQAAEQCIWKIEGILSHHPGTSAWPMRFLACRLLEGDKELPHQLRLGRQQAAAVAAVREQFGVAMGDPVTGMAGVRYRAIETICNRVIRQVARPKGITATEIIDRVVTNRFLALPVFGLFMLCMFWLAFGPPGSMVRGWMDVLVAGAGEFLRRALVMLGASQWVQSLVTDGVCAGVGGVLKFLPQMLILFLFLSLLEDSGYMARAAFIMDRLMRGIGLSGKAFIPMLLGFGCTVPAVMAARAVESERDRKMTILLTPFMSCGAKLPIYALFAGTFFAAHQMRVVAILYIIGMITAAGMGFAIRQFRGENEIAPFVMELPPYRWPRLGATVRQVWQRSQDFLRRATTVIVAMSIVVWALGHFTPSWVFTADSAQSLFALVGEQMLPFFRPLGFEDWRAVVSLLAGVVAKEGVVSTLQVLSTPGGVHFAAAAGFTPLSACSYMVFCLLYMPCVAAAAAIRRETSWIWMALSLVLTTSTAYGVAFIVYQLGRLCFFAI